MSTWAQQEAPDLGCTITACGPTGSSCSPRGTPGPAPDGRTGRQHSLSLGDPGRPGHASPPAALAKRPARLLALGAPSHSGAQTQACRGGCLAAPPQCSPHARRPVPPPRHLRLGQPGGRAAPSWAGSLQTSSAASPCSPGLQAPGGQGPGQWWHLLVQPLSSASDVQSLQE